MASTRPATREPSAPSTTATAVQSIHHAEYTPRTPRPHWGVAFPAVSEPSAAGNTVSLVPVPGGTRRQSASGCGRNWKCTILLGVPWPPSMCQLKLPP